MPQRSPRCQVNTAGLRAFHHYCLFFFVKAALRARLLVNLLCFCLTSVLGTLLLNDLRRGKLKAFCTLGLGSVEVISWCLVCAEVGQGFQFGNLDMMY